MSEDSKKTAPVVKPVSNSGRSDTWTPLPGALYDGAGRVVAVVPGATDPWAGRGDRR